MYWIRGIRHEYFKKKMKNWRNIDYKYLEMDLIDCMVLHLFMRVPFDVKVVTGWYGRIYRLIEGHSGERHKFSHPGYDDK